MDSDSLSWAQIWAQPRFMPIKAGDVTPALPAKSDTPELWQPGDKIRSELVGVNFGYGDKSKGGLLCLDVDRKADRNAHQEIVDRITGTWPGPISASRSGQPHLWGYADAALIAALASNRVAIAIKPPPSDLTIEVFGRGNSYINFTRRWLRPPDTTAPLPIITETAPAQPTPRMERRPAPRRWQRRGGGYRRNRPVHPSADGRGGRCPRLR